MIDDDDVSAVDRIKSLRFTDAPATVLRLLVADVILEVDVELNDLLLLLLLASLDADCDESLSVAAEVVVVTVGGCEAAACDMLDSLLIF